MKPSQNSNWRRAQAVLTSVLLVLLAGCGPEKPIRVGFIGGLSDRNSDNGQAGLNGVMLAIEQANRSGGVNGRQIELVPRDDAQNKDIAEKSSKELVALKVDAIVGPFTSSMAAAIVPITGQAGIFQVSPTVTSMDFYGKNDNLFRINRTTRASARDYAKVLTGRGQQNIAVAYDKRNINFTRSWLNEFRGALLADGASISAEVPYESSATADFKEVLETMLASTPDGLFFISGAVDVARLAQQARMLAPALPIGASEWAATEQLAELGGKFTDGLLIAQNHDRDDQSARFKEFANAYLERYQRVPGYSSVLAHDAATVVIQALRARKEGESLKDAALRAGPYEGLQQTIRFDENGDTERKVYFTEIHAGKYVKVP